MNIEQAINISKGCVMVSFMDSETKQAVIEALSQVAIPKTETTSCEWCEPKTIPLCSAECVRAKIDDESQLISVNYCPNCGRKLN